MRALNEIGRRVALLAHNVLDDGRGNVAMMFGLSSIVLLSAAGGALDWSRAMVTKTRLAAALDSAGLAVGTTTGLTQDQMQAKAQQYFNANYPAGTIGTPGPVSVIVNGQAISLSVNAQVPTTLLKVLRIDTINLSVSNEIVRAVTRLRVALVLDNTGSMSEADGTGTSKISALKSATHQLLTQLQGAAINPGDVQVALIPFALDVNVGMAAVGQNWIDWSDWGAAPSGGAPANTVGPGGDDCPWSTGSNGFRCTSGPANTLNCNVTGSSACVTDIPSNGKICPSARSGSTNNGGGGHFYNGCYDSVATKTTTTTDTNTTPVTEMTQSCKQTGSGSITCTNNSGTFPQPGTMASNSTTATTAGYTGDSVTNTSVNSSTATVDGSKSCSGTGSSKKCTWTRTMSHTQTATKVTKVGAGPWNHTWQANTHDTWGGCFMDRTQNYDTTNTTPSPGTVASLFPAENNAYCTPAVIKAMSYDWSALSSAVDTMSPNGATNQTIGFSWGWQALTAGAPLSAPASDNLTNQIIIILSDGLNTQNRWHGNGSNQDSTVDAREAIACANAKAASVIVYTLFVDLGGTSGNSAPLQNCASDGGKYFDLTTSGQIVSAFNQIGIELANLHIAE